MRLQNEKLGIDVEVGEILHRHIENFFREKRELDGENVISLSVPEDRGNVLRAACRAGIISDGLKDGGVGDLAPAAALWLARKLDEVLAEVLTIPGE